MLLSFLQPKASADEFQCETETVNLFSCVSVVALLLDLNTCQDLRISSSLRVLAIVCGTLIDTKYGGVFGQTRMHFNEDLPFIHVNFAKTQYFYL